MAQQDKPVNLFIRDANGQMIKLVQSTGVGKQSGAPIQLPGSAAVFKAVNVGGFKGSSKLVPLPSIGQLQKVTVVSPTVQATSTIKKIQSQSTPSASPKLVNTVSFVRQPVEEAPPMSSPVDKKNSISRLIVHSRKRQDSETDISPEYTTKRRKAADKVGKGLRHFSMKVCEKVRKKQMTSYNEVADELVAEFTAGLHGSETQQFDQKNIRRRVYDALNVLMAMNIISKEKKEIRWLGLPTNSAQECSTLEREKKIKLERIQQKTQQLHDLILQQVSFKSLVERNKAAESRGMTPSQASSIQLPFIVVNTSEKALIDCSISHDKMEFVFNFNEKFQISDDIDILKRMGLLLGLDKGKCSEEDIQKAKSMVPKSLEHYIERLGRGIELDVDDLLNVSKVVKKEELSETEELDIDTEDSYTGNYSDEEEQDELESTSDVDINGE